MKNKGQASTAAVNLLVFAVMGIIAILIYGQFDQTAQTSLASSTTALRTVGNWSANTYNAYQVISIGPTVLAAVAVLGIVSLLLYLGRR